MSGRPALTIVGPGRLGTALARALYSAGYAVDEIVARATAESLRHARSLARRVHARATTLDGANFAAPVVWICVGDRDISSMARDLAPVAEWRGKTVFHASGALSSDELTPLRRRGAAVASVHPMMSFVHDSPPSLAGVGFGLEGDAPALRRARHIVADLKADAFSLKKSAKGLYHAWGAFGSPLLIMELTVAERIARRAGLTPDAARRVLEPMVRRTIDNYFARGRAKAFSGPFVRGDIATVQRHLKELARVPGAREVYLALARAAIKDLPVANRRAIAKLLG